LRAGGFPSKFTLPVTDEATVTGGVASATPDQSHTATAPVASHNVFRITRRLSHLVIAELLSVVCGGFELVWRPFIRSG
jgi:hypothetical protein